MNETQRLYSHQIDSGALVLVDRAMDALEGADALALVTEWQEFRSPDFSELVRLLRAPVIFDGRNVYDPTLMRRLGISYFGIGRGESVKGDFR
jgi:UDPglucose 6-dehydrogenase